jgi:hypothetical protein
VFETPPLRHWRHQSITSVANSRRSRARAIRDSAAPSAATVCTTLDQVGAIPLELRSRTVHLCVSAALFRRLAA